MITLKLYLGALLTATIALIPTLIRMVDCVGGLMFVQGPTSNIHRVEDVGLYGRGGLGHRERFKQQARCGHRCLSKA